MKWSSKLFFIFWITFLIPSTLHTMEDEDCPISNEYKDFSGAKTPSLPNKRLYGYIPTAAAITSLSQQGYAGAYPIVQKAAQQSVQTAKEFVQTPATTFFEKMQNGEFDTAIAQDDTRSVVSAAEKAFRHKFEPFKPTSQLKDQRNQKRIAAIIQELEGLKERTHAEIFLNQTLAHKYIPLQIQAYQEKLDEIALQTHPEILANFQIDLDECVETFLENYANLYKEYQRSTRACLEETRISAANLRYLYACAPTYRQPAHILTSPSHYESLDAYEDLLTTIQKKAPSNKKHTSRATLNLSLLLQKIDSIEDGFEEEQSKTTLQIQLPELFETQESSTALDTFTDTAISTIMEKSDLANHHHQIILAKLLAQKMKSLEIDQSLTMEQYQKRQADIYNHALSTSTKKIDQEKQRWNNVSKKAEDILSKRTRQHRLQVKQIAENSMNFDELTQYDSGLPKRPTSFDTQEGFEYMVTRHIETNVSKK